MLVRRLRAFPHSRCSLRKSSRPCRPIRCRYSSTACTPAPNGDAHAPLTALAADLDRLAPRIDIEADQVQIIYSPADFYEKLTQKLRGAKTRIFLSTLYIGKSEHELISTIRHALQHNGPDLRISILTDALRGTREAPDQSCASLLAPLVKDFPKQVDVRMYHTPNLVGIRKALIPKRINEGWGLQHMKLYGVDDEVILSGANLSTDYFTNRQDRYHIFQSRNVSDFFAKVHTTVCSLSFRLQASEDPDGHILVWPSESPAPNPLEEPKRYVAAATELLGPLIAPHSTPRARETTTSLYPLLVHPSTLNNELPAIQSLFARDHLDSYTFTAGYFNPHPAVTACLLAASSPSSAVPGTVLTASPLANGFFGSKGISGMLPAAYTHLSSQFLRAARGKNIQLREWQREIVGESNGWTYHAKGLWVSLPSRPGKAQSILDCADDEAKGSKAMMPNATLIGSSNYTTRSYSLDLEVGAMVVSSDEGLRRKWAEEVKELRRYTEKVSEGQLGAEARRASWKVRVAMWIVKAVGGAL